MEKEDKANVMSFQLLSCVWGASQHLPIFFVFHTQPQGKVLQRTTMIAAEVLPLANLLNLLIIIYIKFITVV